MHRLDRRGNPVSTASTVAQDAAETALWRMMSFYGDPLADLDAAAAADPGWPLPPLMKAGFLLSLTEPSVRPQARALLDTAAGKMASATPRERAHFDALRLLATGDWCGACRTWETVLLRHPRDALALQWAHLFDFYLGDATQLRQRVARVLPEWDEADALHPYLLGLHAFGLEECSRYDEAEACGRRALAAAKVPWALHAVAHVMEMQGRHEEGSAWMRQWRDDWMQGNGFKGHLGWHDALFALERLDLNGALACFDAHLAADPAQISLQRLDAASLLWRLHLLGAEVGSRWHRLLGGWDVSTAAAGLSTFNDVHVLLALLGAAACGDGSAFAAAEDWAQRAARRAAAAGGTQASVANDVGAPLMQGLLAFAQARFDTAIELLYPLRAAVHRIGGSHAQRDLIDQTLIAAATGATDRHGTGRAAGRALLNERRLAKPLTPLTEHWLVRLGTAATSIPRDHRKPPTEHGR